MTGIGIMKNSLIIKNSGDDIPVAQLEDEEGRGAIIGFRSYPYYFKNKEETFTRSGFSIKRNYSSETEQKDYSKKMWSNWVTRLYYWQGALLISGGLTVALLFALKSVNILQF